MVRVILPLLAALLFLVGGCSAERNEELYRQQAYVFGTIVDISIWGSDRELAERAVDAVARDFQRMHYEWHAWEPGPLTELNAAIASGGRGEVVPSLRPLIAQSRVLYERSEGLFNPAIGGLLRLWGFQSSERPNGPPPREEAIAGWVALAPGMDDVILEEGGLTSRNRAVQLDFGAFAKGYAVDLAIERLRALGVENAIVNGGGDLRAIGRPGKRPWRVGIRHPQGQGVLAALEVQGDESVFTSGNYERYNEFEGVRYTHILDPRTGMPVKGITSVTVIHDNGAEADAAATALVVAGVEAWHRIARKMGMKYVMLVDEAGAVHMDPAMAARVIFQEPRPVDVRISEPL